MESGGLETLTIGIKNNKKMTKDLNKIFQEFLSKVADATSVNFKPMLDANPDINDDIFLTKNINTGAK